MTGKMLPRGEHPVLLQAADEGRSQRRHELRVLAKGSRSDDRIVAVVVHIEHGRKCEVHSKRTAFDGSDPTLVIAKAAVARSPERHLVQEERRTAEKDSIREEVATGRAEPRPSLIVGPDDQRHSAQALHRVELYRRFYGRPDRDHESADALRPYEPLDALPAGR